MNYTLNQLNVFLHVAKTGSVTKAAEELNLSQPAVSIQLKNFQEQFDIPLAEVIGKKIFITEFGKEIVMAAEKILHEVQAIKYKSSQYKGQLSGKLKFSVVSTGKYVMPFFLSGFLRANTNVDLQMDVTNRAKVLEHLDRNEVDFALVSILPDNISVDKIDLLPNKLYLVGSPQHAMELASGDQMVFQKVPLIFREQGSGTRKTMEYFLERQNLKVRKSIELSTNEAVKLAVLAGLGCSIMPLIGIKSELKNQQLQIIPVKGLPIQTTWQLVWLKNKQLSVLAEAFRDYVVGEKEQIIKQYF